MILHRIGLAHLFAPLLFLAACGPAAFNQPSAAPATPAGYREAAAAFDAALSAKDRAALDALIAEDFAWVRGSGVKGGKALFIETLTASTISIEPFQPTEAHWFVTSDSALHVATNNLRGTSSGEPFVDRHRFADHWHWRDGRWRLVYAQVTPVLAER